MKYIAYVIFAVIFISAGFAIYALYQRGTAEQEFRLKAEELAGQIESMGGMSAGTILNFEITVPESCELRFTDNMVSILIGDWSDNFSVGLPVSGQTFSNQRLSLRLERTGSGVSVNEV